MLRLENLSFEVNDDKGEKGIIKDISLTVDDGKFVVITGPNGGGKSTTAKLIMGIEHPTGERSGLTGRTLQKRALQTVQRWVSVLHSSSRFALREFR